MKEQRLRLQRLFSYGIITLDEFITAMRELRDLPPATGHVNCQCILMPIHNIPDDYSAVDEARRLLGMGGCE